MGPVTMQLVLFLYSHTYTPLPLKKPPILRTAFYSSMSTGFLGAARSVTNAYLFFLLMSLVYIANLYAAFISIWREELAYGSWIWVPHYLRVFVFGGVYILAAQRGAPYFSFWIGWDRYGYLNLNAFIYEMVYSEEHTFRCR